MGLTLHRYVFLMYREKVRIEGPGIDTIKFEAKHRHQVGKNIHHKTFFRLMYVFIFLVKLR